MKLLVNSPCRPAPTDGSSRHNPTVAALAIASRPIVALAALVAIGCGTTGGGAPQVAFTGQAVDATCNPQFHNEGCHINLKVQPAEKNRMRCDTATSKWTLIETCAANTFCQELADKAAPGTVKKVTECKASATTTTDTIGGGDTTGPGQDATGSDAKTADTNINATEIFACVKSKCATEYAACSNDAKCKTQVACAEKCTTTECAAKCFEPFSADGPALALLMCGDAKGCTPKNEPKPVCGDAKCQGDESPTSCPQDCSTVNPKCGNGLCDAGESTASCPADCKSNCGNGKCDAGESTSSCPADCKAQPTCGDGKCEGAEPETCAKDCTTGPKCGNAVCESGETPSSCPVDCKTTPKCGNGACESGESPSSCPADCKTTPTGGCGDMTCGSGETTTNCALDCDAAHKSAAQCVKSQCGSQYTACLADEQCGFLLKCGANCKCNESCQKACASDITSPSPALMAFGQCAQNVDCPDPCAGSAKCGNGTCESGESPSSCPGDCKTSLCGNGKCDNGETQSTCPIDCKPTSLCGNGKCDSGETTSCPSDCKAVCGNGKCEAGESKTTCAPDCGTTTGTPGCVESTTPGCNGCACEACVCAADDFCCKTAWDNLCVQACGSKCGTTCPAPPP